MESVKLTISSLVTKFMILILYYKISLASGLTQLL